MEKQLRVLLIDDEVDFLEITAKRLSRRGFQVTTAATCTRGLQELRTVPLDVIILDVMLPDIDGLKCLKEINQLFPAVAVILLTGHASMETGLKSLQYGASDYCLKPVALEELVEKIEIAHRDKEK